MADSDGSTGGAGLADSASPYLRAHAGNPVHWRPWGPEAFAEAARRDVPVFVSIGYSTCHWCHVMARESFQDETTAAALNAGFVAVKVDREERPEVDDAYMAAASAFTKGLGWPLSVFTTPRGGAFFAGTYFPDEPRGGAASFRQVLAAVRDAWEHHRPEVERTAHAVVTALADRPTAPAAFAPDVDALAAAARAVLAREDSRYGGFGAPEASMSTPKFPAVPVLRFLQSPLLAGIVPDAAPAAARALAAMAASPLRDGVDGGFFRYATRRDWTVPHYERMLADNAGLIDVALDAGDDAAVRGAAGFLLDVLQLPGGGFATAQDSESVIDGARSEGGYYLRDAAGRAQLAAPAIDGKLVTGLNGMAVGALADAGRRLRAPALIAAASRAAHAVRAANVRADGSLRRASLGETASDAPATLADHGLLAGGLLRLADAAGDEDAARWARELVDRCLTDPPAAPERDGVLAAFGIASAAGTADTDHPSGPSALADACVRLWRRGAGERYRQAAASLVAATGGTALAQPLAHGALLRAAANLLEG